MSIKQVKEEVLAHVSRSIKYPLIVDELSHLLGQILTIVDASVVDAEQRKAVKDLVRDKFNERMYEKFWDYCYRRDMRIEGSLFEENIVEGEDFIK